MKGKPLIGFAALAFVLALPLAYAIPVDFWGYVTINVSSAYNVTPNGANITAHINGSDIANASAIVGVGLYGSNSSNATTGHYLVSVPCLPGDNVSFRIYNVLRTKSFVLISLE